MINWPTDLIQSIAHRKCVLFLGAGISASAVNKQGKHPATWEVFLREVFNKRQGKLSKQKIIIDELLNRQDYLIACEVMTNIIGENDFGELAADEFRRPGYEPAEIHKEIYRLDSKIVITPNIDKIYEQYVMNESNSTAVAKSYYDEDIAKFLRTQDYLIIRAHGTVDETSKLIFTHKQYSLARTRYSAFYKLLDALILTHTFIFLGCGINDPDIELILENANFLYPNCKSHYFVTAAYSFEHEIEKILAENRNIEILTYNNQDGTHADLLNSLKDLNIKVEEARKIIADQQIW